MGEKKSSAVLLTVIGIATLIATLVGASFAYFTAQVNSTEGSVTQDVTITAAELGTIVFDHTDKINLTNAYPGDGDTVDFSVTAAEGATAGVPYEVYLVVTENSFVTDNLKATLTSDKAVDNSLANATSLNSTGTYKAGQHKIGTGIIQPGATDTWSLNVALDEIKDVQNQDQSKTFVAQIKVVVEGEGQYTQDSVYGTN